VDGATFLGDDQFMGDRVEEVGAAAPGGYPYHVRLRCVDPPRPARPSSAGGTLEVVLPEEMFARIEIDETIDLEFAEVETSPPRRVIAGAVTRHAASPRCGRSISDRDMEAKERMDRMEMGQGLSPLDPR
jgi:hypothetical protein